MRARRVLILLTLPILLAGVGTIHAQTAPMAYPAARPVATADAAVGEAVAQTPSAGYAGDCSGTTPENRGQLCSKHVADKGPLSAYLIGRAFSEYTQWVFVQQTPSGWVPISGAPLDQSAMSLSVPWPAG